jgi:hypothetical protein
MSITERALIKRINRKLAPKYERVCKLRSPEYGTCWHSHENVYNNSLIAFIDDLEEFGRELGVLESREVLA